MELEYDPFSEILTINGVQFHTDLFKYLTQPTPEGFALRVLSKVDGVVTIQQFEL